MVQPSYAQWKAHNTETGHVASLNIEDVLERILSTLSVMVAGTNPDGSAWALPTTGGGGVASAVKIQDSGGVNLASVFGDGSIRSVISDGAFVNGLAGVTAAHALQVDGSAVNQPVFIGQASGIPVVVAVEATDPTNVFTDTVTIDTSRGMWVMQGQNPQVAPAPGSAWYQKITDGTHTALVSATGGLRVDQGAGAGTAAGSWPVVVTDGTNTLGTVAHPLNTNVLNTPLVSVTNPIQLTDTSNTRIATITAAGALEVDATATTQPISNTPANILRVDAQGDIISQVLFELKRISLILESGFNVEISDLDVTLEALVK